MAVGVTVGVEAAAPTGTGTEAAAAAAAAREAATMFACDHPASAAADDASGVSWELLGGGTEDAGNGEAGQRGWGRGGRMERDALIVSVR